MSLEAHLEAQIAADPDDEAPRSVLGDLLVERGDPRGELIALGRLGGPREQELLAEHGPSWEARVRELGALEVVWRRGFIEGVTVPLADFLARGEALFSVAPITALRLVAAGRRELPRLAPVPSLARLRSLDLSRNELDASAVARLVESPFLGRLRRLGLAHNDLPDAGARALARAPLASLEALDLAGNVIEDEGAEALASSSLGRLRELSLEEPGRGNCITPAGVRALASPRSFRLEALSLAHNPVALGGAEALAESPASASLRRLGLRDAQLGPSAALALAGLGWLAGLEVLELEGNPLGPMGLEHLAVSPFLSRDLVLAIGPGWPAAARARLRRRFPRCV